MKKSMKKASYLNRLTALLMVGVMILSLVVFDGSFGSKAEDEQTTLAITATLDDTDYAVDISEETTDEDAYDIYVNKTELESSGASVKVKLDITSDATSTDALKVTYTYTDTSNGETTSDVTADGNDYYVTLTGTGKYVFKVEYGREIATATKTVKFAEEDSVDATTSLEDAGSDKSIIAINTSSNGTSTSYTSIQKYNEAVTNDNIWCKSIKSLNLVFTESNTFIKTATVTYEEYEETAAVLLLAAANNSKELYSNENVNATSFDFSVALGKINNLEDGKYKITFETVSFLGAKKSVSLYVFLDNEAPTIELKTDGGGSSDSTIDASEYVISDEGGETLTITVTDTDSGIDTTETSVTVSDASSTKALTATTEGVYSCTFGGTDTYSAVGTYTLSITAADNAGNSSTRELTVIVDDEAPTIAISKVTVDSGNKEITDANLAGTSLLYVNGDKTTASFTVTGYGITKKDVSYTVSVDDTDKTTESYTDSDNVEIELSEGTGNINTITYTFTLTDTGTYTFTFNANAHYATDNTTSKSFGFIVYDTGKPEITTVNLGEFNEGSNGVRYYKNYPTIKVTATDDMALDYITIEDSGNREIYRSDSLTANNVTNNDFKVTLDDSYIDENKVYTITFYAVDKAGNKSDSKNYNIAVDTTVPTVSIKDSSKIEYWNNSEDVKLNISAEDNLCLAGLKVVATCDGVSLTDPGYSLEGISGEATLTYTGDGLYVVKIYACDAAGNESLEATTSFVIDTKAPEIEITGIPSDGVWANDGSETITITATDKYGILTDDVNITLHYETYDGESSGTETINNATADTASKVITSEVTKCIVVDEKPMKYYFTVTAADESGNEAAEYTSDTFYYDEMSPDLSVDPDLSGEDTVYYNSDVSFDISVAEQFDLGTNIYILDATDYAASGSETAYANKAYSSFELEEGELEETFTQKVTEEGTYNWVIVAVDSFGNEKAIKNIDFVIDKTNPVAEVQGVPDSGLSTGTTVSIVITDNETLDASSFTVTGYWKYYDSSTYNKVNVSVKSVNAKTLKASMYCGEKNNKACSYYFTVTGKDRAGNAVKYTVSDSNLKVDATAPTVTISPLPEETNDGYYNSNVSFTISVTEQYSNTTTIKVSDANKATNGDEDEIYYLKDTNGTFTIKRSSQGIYNLKITVTDAFGNKTEKTVNFVIDKTKPEIVIGAVNKLNNGNVSVKVNITDNYKGKSYRVHVVRKNSAGTVVYDKDMLDEEWNNKSVSPTLSFSDEGDYTVTVYSTDKAGNEAEVDSTTFRIDKTAPVLSITGVNDTQTSDCTATMSVEEAFAFTYEGNSLAAGDISVTITKKTDGSAESTVATLSTSDFSSGNPHTASYSFSEDGEYTITFTAKDLTGNTATTVTKTFKVDKTAPEILVTAVNSSNSEISEYQVVGGNTEDDADYVSMRITVNETFFASNNVTIKVTKDGVDVSKDYFANFSSTSATSTGSQEFLEDGVYTVDITAVDALGNAAEAYNLVFTIDNTAPTIEATEKLTGFISRVTDDGVLLLNSNDFADILNMGYEAFWDVNDTSVFDVVVKLDGVDFVDFTDLTDGYHTMSITVTDEVGHVTSQEFSFTYDGTAPRIIITGVEDGDVVREAFTMTISLEDEDDYITSIVINGETIDPSLYEDTNVYEYQVEEYGDYEVVVYAEDIAGNTASTYDSETGEAFSFSYKQQVSIALIVIIIIIAILLILLIILLIRRYRNKNKDRKK